MALSSDDDLDVNLESTMLLALSRLQGENRTAKKRQNAAGITFKKIVDFLRVNFSWVDGDLESQVITTLLSCVKKGIVCALDEQKFLLLGARPRKMPFNCLTRVSHGPKCCCLPMLKCIMKTFPRTCCYVSKPIANLLKLKKSAAGVKPCNQPRVKSAAGVRSSNQPRVKSAAGVKSCNQPRVKSAAGVRPCNQPRVKSAAGVRPCNQPRVKSAAGVRPCKQQRAKSAAGVRSCNQPRAKSAGKNKSPTRKRKKKRPPQKKNQKDCAQNAQKLLGTSKSALSVTQDSGKCNYCLEAHSLPKLSKLCMTCYPIGGKPSDFPVDNFSPRDERLLAFDNLVKPIVENVMENAGN